MSCFWLPWEVQIAPKWLFRLEIIDIGTTSVLMPYVITSNVYLSHRVPIKENCTCDLWKTVT